MAEPWGEIRFTMDVRGLDAAVRQLPDLLESVVEVGGRNIEASAKRIIIAKRIIDTGATLNSTQSRSVAGDRLARRIGPTTLYAPYLEFGTRQRAARPFMQPALDENRAGFAAAVKSAIERFA